MLSMARRKILCVAKSASKRWVMSGSVCGMLALVVVLGWTLPVAGQMASNQTVSLPTNHSAQVARLPYTAEYKEHNITPGPYGNSVGELTKVDAVDSQGRQMTSLLVVSLIVPQSNGETRDITSSAVGPNVSVIDPVAGTISYWRALRKTVKVTAIHRAGAALSTCATASTSTLAATKESTTKSESVDLGIRTFAGIEARGRLITITRFEDTAGNNEPQVRTLEVWNSTTPGQEKLVVYEVSDDPKMGKSTTELVNLIQGEPDPSLFQPPADFKIVRVKEPDPVCPTTQKVELKPDSPPVQ